ncbi:MULTISPECIES: GtrA family protein [unclassified Ruegeria]|uniref:GtrA family protein n=1 Tax=unclassified Ruegeria TaxID=2625375 RepID=UPI001488D650|nr:MULTISPECIES: GtrA family protein [unclassified Ruegeria]
MRSDSRRFLHFVLVGLLNTLVGYLIYAALVFLGLPPQPALALAFFLGVLWNFFTHAKLVFSESAQGFKKFPAYALCYGVIYLFNAFGLQLALGTGLSPYLAQAIMAPAAAVLSFLLIGKVLTGRFPFTKA